MRLVDADELREEMNNHESCPLYPYCVTQKHEHESCDDMVRRYNAGLLLPPEYIENSELS